MSLSARECSISPAFAGRYRALLGEPLVVHIANFVGYGVAFASLALGGTTVTLLAPTREPVATDSEDAPAVLARDLRKHLATRGEGLFGVTLRTGSDTFAQALPLAQTHGALLELTTTR